MKDNYLLFVSNGLYGEHSKSEMFYNSLLFCWAKCNDYDYINDFDKRRINLNEGFFTDMYTSVDFFVKDFKDIMKKYKATYLVFNSFYDINYKLCKALRYVAKLADISDKYNLHVYILTLNAAIEVKDYLYIGDLYNDLRYRSLESIHGDFRETRDTPERDAYELFELAKSLRVCEYPVRYPVIEKYTGIKKGTLNDYIKRTEGKENYKRICDNTTGRKEDELTPEEIERINEVKSSLIRPVGSTSKKKHFIKPLVFDINEFCASVNDILDDISLKDKVTIIEDHSRRKNVIISYERYRRLMDKGADI